MTNIDRKQLSLIKNQEEQYRFIHQFGQFLDLKYAINADANKNSTKISMSQFIKFLEKASPRKFDELNIIAKNSNHILTLEYIDKYRQQFKLQKANIE